MSEISPNVYNVKVGEKVKVVGKIFSYTFWRTQIDDDVFWSIQGVDNGGCRSAWIVTHYLGPYEQGKLYEQQITLRDPCNKKIKLMYASNCFDGENRVEIARSVVNQFKDERNRFNFNFRIVKRKRKHPIRMF
uniref:Uncharacterized protein n=1 Tax=Photinus pyralis TaxID=7054 RepID=A0A1Y1MRD3_PHOPY